MTDIALALTDVVKRFGDKQVLNTVSLEVKRGQTVAFLGRNGAGKTTTMRLLIGLLKADGGSISVLGRDPLRDALDVRRRTGYLAEDQSMFGWMTVDEILSFTAPFYPTWDHALAIRYAKLFELPANTKVNWLSKGQTVRLGLLLALAHRPELVLLDDPVSGLDPVMRKEFNRDLITHLQDEGQTIFYSSHLLYEVEPMADQVAILHEGGIVRYEAAETLRQDVKRLIASKDRVATLMQDSQLLDVDHRGSETAVIVASAQKLIAELQAEGCEFRVQDLSLDEIFEAYVIGCKDESGSPPAEPVSQFV
jgi:ABC-2 type transport system ATP-binding protein